MILNEFQSIRLRELEDVPRVELPPGFPDDSGNRLKGLVDMVTEYFSEDTVLMELGTGMGVSTEVFALLCKHVHTADIWPKANWKQAFEVMAMKYTNITSYHRDFNDCCRFFNSQSLDAVYIDGCHTYDRVLNDIKNWIPKIKPTGFICGHDYISRPRNGYGVIKAVGDLLGAPDKVYEDTSWIIKLAA